MHPSGLHPLQMHCSTLQCNSVQFLLQMQTPTTLIVLQGKYMVDSINNVQRCTLMQTLMKKTYQTTNAQIHLCICNWIVTLLLVKSPPECVSLVQITNSLRHFHTSFMSLGPYKIFMHLYVPWPLGSIGFTCIYTSLGSFRRPIWPDIFCKYHPLRGLYNRGRGV